MTGAGFPAFSFSLIQPIHAFCSHSFGFRATRRRCDLQPCWNHSTLNRVSPDPNLRIQKSSEVRKRRTSSTQRKWNAPVTPAQIIVSEFPHFCDSLVPVEYTLVLGPNQSTSLLTTGCF